MASLVYAVAMKNHPASIDGQSLLYTGAKASVEGILLSGIRSKKRIGLHSVDTCLNHSRQLAADTVKVFVLLLHRAARLSKLIQLGGAIFDALLYITFDAGKRLADLLPENLPQTISQRSHSKL
mgnify:FL=1